MKNYRAELTGVFGNPVKCALNGAEHVTIITRNEERGAKACDARVI